MRTLSRKATIVIFSMAGFVAACRSDDSSHAPMTQESPPLLVPPAPSGSSPSLSSSGSGGGPNGPDSGGSTSTGSASVSSSSGMVPHEGNPEYVTDILVYAACEVDGGDVAVANGHASTTECERIVLTPAHNDDGDFYEVATSFIWVSTDPSALTVSCLNGPNDNFCWPVGHADLFDPSQLNEPTAAITACAQNDCPIPRPADCADEVCVNFAAESVVNIEGAWSLSGATFDPGATMAPTQDGRSFEDPVAYVKRGTISAWSLRFEIDDFLYTGGFTDRDHIQGDVEDSILGGYIGSWSAERTSM